MSKFQKGDPVEVTLEDGTTKVGRFKWLHSQYNFGEVHFADGQAIYNGPLENIRSLDDDELELRAQAPQAEKPAPSGAAAETSNK